MSSLPPSWETFVTTVCNASTTAIKYSEITSAIPTEAAWRKSFGEDSADEAYVVQGSADRPNNRGRSSSRPMTISEAGVSPGTTESAIIARNPDTSKPISAHSKPKMIKLNEQIRKSGWHEEVNYVGSSAEIQSMDPKILSIENPVE